MLYILVFSVFGITCIAIWCVQIWVQTGFVRYQRAFTIQASKDLGDMFLFLDPKQVWIASLLLCGLSAFIAYVFAGSLLFAIALSAVMLFAPPYALTHARRRRLEKLEHQLPDLLLALAGALRSGTSMQAALRHSAEHMATPLSQELGLMLREQRMGVPFEQALANLYQRAPTESLSLLVSALNIAAQSGGSLAETLERMSVSLRTRLHLLGRIRALTSQGRMQAWIMAGLPVALAVVLHWLDPDAMSALWFTPGGWVVLLAVVILEVVGMFFIRRIVRIDV